MQDEMIKSHGEGQVLDEPENNNILTTKELINYFKESKAQGLN